MPRPDDSRTDALLARARDGAPDAAAEAVDELLHDHRDFLRRLIDQRIDPVLRRRVDASDIVQDVLLEANRRLQEYLRDPAMPFHVWLRHLARDRIIDMHRRHRGAARRSIDREQPLAAVPADESAPDWAGQIPDSELTPAAAATFAEMQRRFRDAVERLEPLDREVISLRHFDQLSNQQVAERLHLTDAAAGMRYLRAIRRLRHLLSPDPPAPPPPGERGASAP